MPDALKINKKPLLLPLIASTIIHLTSVMFFLMILANCSGCDGAFILIIVAIIHLIILRSIFSFREKILKIALALNFSLLVITAGFLFYYTWLYFTYETPQPSLCDPPPVCISTSFYIDPRPQYLTFLKYIGTYFIFNLISLFGILKIKRVIAKS